MQVMDEETYLSVNNASRQDFGEPALHKNIQEGRNKRWLLNRMLDKDRALAERRRALRKEYAMLVAAGEIRPPARIERLLATSKGMEENEAVRAARRLLTKTGIDWETGSPFSTRED